ncbi:uncharacterized protein A1O9_04033 [Exophiala aquamarina CBS 119918]|uniref:Major facilitator superfamily (MFS) profile domain-containing protein n=1 Tax=Exophiala aquamarina CBS 119918 TaxID=1182545 RepID=A0A072PGD3_9EURO|nr:uncharacterized protein A1O9_04033 [Exophiala aquamarina CBS 119918]KEF59189.1 hypothetical protein A1O9_04033 [Exophiala aquamarina CBS 119918]
MLSYWTDYGMSFVSSEAQFQFPIALQILFALVTIALIVFLPESPRWLIAKARSVIDAELKEIQRALEEEREAAGSTNFFAVLKKSQRFSRRALLGIGAVIFEVSVGMPHNLVMLLAGFNGIAYFLSSLIPIWCLDRILRRNLMIFACEGQAACMAILAGTVSNGSYACGIVATVMLFLFNFFFPLGLLAIPWLLPAEYAPLASGTKAAAVATASNWIFTS